MTRRLSIGLAVAIAALQAFLLVHTALDKSDTVDEPLYLAVGVRQARLLDLRANCEAPALPKWGFALALRSVDAELFAADTTRGWDPLWSRTPSETRRNLVAGRVATITVVVLGGLALWAAGLAFSPWAALVAHLLYAFSPTVLAHGSLATLDGWAAAFTCFTLLAGVRLWQSPSALRVVACGVLLGLGAACKVTTLAVAPVLLVLLWRRPRLVALLAASAFLALWSVYAFGVGPVDIASPCEDAVTLPSKLVGPLPFPQWIEGVVQQSQHGQEGHLNYLNGSVQPRGWWWFYLAAIAFKTTIGAQVLFLLLLFRRRPSWVDAALLAPALLQLLVLSAGNVQLGIRYLLPAFPLVMLWMGRAAAGSSLRYAVAGLLAVGTAESLLVHPHHLMFFSAWAGGPANGPRHLVVSDDWGQDQKRLGAWQQENRPPTLYYTYYTGKPEYWGVTWQPAPCEPRPGFYALHAVEVHRPKRTPSGCLDWLTVEPPDERLGYSIYLYKVTRARIDRLTASRGRVEPFWKSGP